jgi:hypothetical protein
LRYFELAKEHFQGASCLTFHFFLSSVANDPILSGLASEWSRGNGTHTFSFPLEPES